MEVMNSTMTGVPEQVLHGKSAAAQAVALLKQHYDIVFGLLVTLYIVQIGYNIFFHPLSKVPGPMLARWSNMWLNFHYWRSSWHNDVLELHQTYGPVVRIRPNEVSFVDDKALKSLFGHGKESRKTPWYGTWLIPKLENSIFATQDVKLHRFIRSRVSNYYTMAAVLATEHCIQVTCDKTWTKFRDYAQKGATVDLSKLITYFAFDAVGELALSRSLGFLDTEDDVCGIIESIHYGFYLMSNMGHMPLQMLVYNTRLAQFLINKWGSKPLRAFNIFLDWLGDQYEDRLRNPLPADQPPDLMQHFIDMKDPAGNPATKGDVVVEGINIIGAGADTTTIALLAIIGFLDEHRDIKAIVQKEVDDAYERLLNSENGMDGEISYKEAVKLPWLCAVVKESTRLHPPIQYNLPRLIPDGGITIGGYYVPTSCHASMSARSMNRNPQVFGDDANEFKPERWIAKTPEEEAANREKTNLLMTFGMGPRICVGQNIAQVELHKFMAQFIRHFDVEITNKEQPWITKTYWFSFQSKFMAKLINRKH